MKSEERHKLHQNALALWLSETFTAIKPYQNAILAGIIVVILAAIFYAWWTSESASAASKAWTQLFAAFEDTNPSAALEKVAEDNRQLSRRAGGQSCGCRHSTCPRLQHALYKQGHCQSAIEQGREAVSSGQRAKLIADHTRPSLLLGLPRLGNRWANWIRRSNIIRK